MPENETRRGQGRYSDYNSAGLYSWYGSPTDEARSEPADAVRSTPNPPNRAVGHSDELNRRRRRTKVISLSVCAVLVVAAVGLGAWRLGRSSALLDRREPGGVYSYSLPDSGEAYDDFRVYFDNYYRSSDAVDIARAELNPNVKLELVPQTGAELSLQDIYDTVNPAVVGISTYVDGQRYSWGTGVVFTRDGYIVTNTHIIQGTEAATVTFSGGDSYEALLVGADEVSDIAVLKIDGADFPCASFGTSDSLRVGDMVVAIGNPLGEEYAGTMTNGIISAIDRNIIYNGHTMTLLQTNAALNEGNSGGPMVNAYGQVIGITNMKIMSMYYSAVEGIGFAIPSSVVKEIADQLLEKGVVSGEASIGITAGSVSQEAQMLYDLPNGVYVASVDEHSDAYKKGLQVGDIILKVNGETVTTVTEINLIKDGMSVGDSLTLTVYRDGKTFDMEICLVDRGLIQ